MPSIEDLGYSHNRVDSITGYNDVIETTSSAETDVNTTVENTVQTITDGSVEGAKLSSLSVEKLTTGIITSERITLAVNDGDGDTYIAAGKTDFDNTTSGFILGIDDSDNNTPKFYIGSTTNYLNWDGSTLTVAGTLVAGEIHIPDIDTTANSFHVESDGSGWIGQTSTLRTTAPIQWTPAGVWDVGNGDGVNYIRIDGPNSRIGTAVFASGVQGWRIDDTGSAEFLNITARGEFHTQVLSYNELHGSSGSEVLVKSAGKLKSDVTTNATSTILDSCDATTGWAATNGTVALNTTTYFEGTGSLDIAKTSAAITEVYISKTIASTNFTKTLVCFFVRVLDQTTYDLINNFEIFLFSGANFGYATIAKNTAMIGAWYRIVVSIDDFVDAGGWDKTAVTSMRFDVNTNNAADVFAAGGVRVDYVHYYRIDGVTLPTTFNVDIDDPDTGHVQLFTKYDTIRFKDGSGNDNWCSVDSVSDQTTFYRYVCYKDNGTSATFRAGAGVFDYGQAGQGLIYSTVDEANAPYVSVQTHTGRPWSTTTEKLRQGNLSGISDVVFGSLSGYGIWTANGYFTGGLVSTSGTIGGWTLGVTTLSATNISLTSGAANTAKLEVGTGSNTGGVNSANGATDIAFWAGDTHANRATAPFRVKANGAIVANSIELTNSKLNYPFNYCLIGSNASATFYRANTPANVGFSDATTKLIAIGMYAETASFTNAGAFYQRLQTNPEIGTGIYPVSDVGSDGVPAAGSGRTSCLYIGTNAWVDNNNAGNLRLRKDAATVTYSGSEYHGALGHDPTNSYLLILSSSTTIRRYSGIAGTTITFVDTITLDTAVDNTGFVYDNTNSRYICIDRANSLVRRFNSSGTTVDTTAYTTQVNADALRGIVIIDSRVHIVVCFAGMGGNSSTPYLSMMNCTFIPVNMTI